MSAVDIVTVHEVELLSPRQVGHRLRAYCHIHGSNHQRSLSIEMDGDAAGYGHCKSCGVKVYVPELAPAKTGGSRRPWRPTAEALLRPVRRPVASAPTPADWQRAELEALQGLAERMRLRLADDRARAYLEERGIPWKIADGAGVGYIPADARLSGGLAKWRDRLVFPLGSPAGVGYAGRSLHGWQPGMDENEHKARLDADPNGPRRWEKTYPAGWFGYDALATSARAVICEGPIDRLALVAAGLELADVVALVGTAARSEWIPMNVEGVILALDGDGPGRERAAALQHELRAVGIKVPDPCTPAEDGQGKDWSARWRLVGLEGVYPVLTALDALAPASVESTHSDAPAVDDTAPWLADPVMRFLLAQGYELVEARLVG